MVLRLHTSFFFGYGYRVAAAVSAACFSVSLVAAHTLIQQNDRLSRCKDPAEAVSSHQSITDEANECCPQIDWFTGIAYGKYKFQGAAFIFACPTAFFNWGIISFFCHWLFIILSPIRPTITIPLIGVVGVVCLLCSSRVMATCEATLAHSTLQASLEEHESARVTQDLV